MRNEHLRNALRVALVAIAASAAVGCGFKPSAAPPVTGSGGTPTIDGGLGTGGTAGGPGKTGATSLTITPTAATMMVTNGGPAQTQQFTVSGQVNGQTVDLTTQVLYAISSSGVVTIATSRQP